MKIELKDGIFEVSKNGVILARLGTMQEALLYLIDKEYENE